MRGNTDNNLPNRLKTCNNNYSDNTYDLLPKVTQTHMMKYEVIECRMGAFHVRPDSDLLWLRGFGYTTNIFRETKSIHIF